MSDQRSSSCRTFLNGERNSDMVSGRRLSSSLTFLHAVSENSDHMVAT